MSIILRTCRLSQIVFTKPLHQTFHHCALYPCIRLPPSPKPVLKQLCHKWKLPASCCPLWRNVISHQLHTSQFRRAPLPAFIWLLIKPLAKLFAMLSGREFRKWWANLPPNKRQVFLKAVSRHRNKIFIGVAAATGVSVTYYVTHLEKTPLTGRQRFVAFNQQQFEKIVDFEYQMTKELYEDDLLPPNHPAYRQVVRVVQQLTQKNRDIKQILERTWAVAVIKSDERNAFVLPNGHIFVFTGMLNAVSNDDQLGFIISHEMAHAILNHGIEQVSFAGILDFMVIIAITIIWAFFPTDLISVIIQWFFTKVVKLMLDLPYSRQLEREADVIGLQMSARACFDVREGSAFWSKMQLQSEDSGEPQIEFLSTHPSHENRSQYLDTLMPEAIELRNICKCPSLPATDPRKVIEKFKVVKPEKPLLIEAQPFGVIVPIPGIQGPQRG